MWCPLFLLISPFCFSSSLNRFGVLVASLSFWYLFIFFHVQDFFRLLLFLVLSGFPYFFALCLLLSLLFPPLCCTCWHLMSNMKIGTTAGKYSMCIVLGPFHKGTRAKRKSATNPPQWIHIPLLCFFVWFVFGLYCCFFVAAFILVAEAQRLIPSTGEQEYWPTICLESLKLPYIYITPYSECNFHILCGGNPEMSFGIYVP